MRGAERDAAVAELKFRDPERARGLRRAIERTVRDAGRDVTVMHVCGSHEQAIARFGLRAVLPEGLDLIMGPGCPVCVTDMPEVDEAVELARQGAVVCTYGDMVRVPGTSASLADAQVEGARVEVVYSVSQAVDTARREPDSRVVFFASGFETTAVATAAAILAEPPPNLSVLSAHKYVPPAMEVVAALPQTRLDGFLAAGHAATITGWGLFEPIAERHGLPIVVAGFEPLDILAALARLAEMIRDGETGVFNAFPRCVTREGNRPAQEILWRVFEPAGGRWRGICDVPEGNLRLREEWSHLDARRLFRIELPAASSEEARALSARCRCGDIMAGLARPDDCDLFGEACRPDAPVGACMVSTEGTCRIWHDYGGRPDLRTAS